MKIDGLILISEGQTVDALLGSAECAIRLARRAGCGDDLRWGIKVAQANLTWAYNSAGYESREDLYRHHVQRALYHLVHAETEEDVEMATNGAKAALNLLRSSILSEMKYNKRKEEEE